MYLLDTNLISEIRKMPKGKCDQGVEQWVKTTSQNLMFTSAVVLMELERGILAMERKDMAQGTMLRTWFEKDVLPAFRAKYYLLMSKQPASELNFISLTTPPKTMRGLLPQPFSIIWCWSRVILMVLPAQA